MSTTKHTAAPWIYTGSVLVEDQNRNVVARCNTHFRMDAEEANAARIVACVNACAGIEDPAAALAEAKEALRKILRHIPASSGGASVSADVHLCKQALRALGG
jgi:hypothetical protein